MSNINTLKCVYTVYVTPYISGECIDAFNPLTGRLNRRATDHYTALRRLVHWPLMGDGLLHLVQRGGAWAGWGPAQSPHRCTKCNSPPINGQCTNFILFDVAL